MKFLEFASYLQKLESTSSRIEITKILAELFSGLSSDEIKNASYLLSGTLAPSFEGIVFNVADKMILRAISTSANIDLDTVTDFAKKSGDMGEAAQHFFNNKKGKDLSVNDVYERLRKIAQEEGEGSQERRIDIISNLFKEIDSQGAKFVARIILGKLRLGFSEKTMIDALSWMNSQDKTSSKEILRAYEVVPDIGLLSEKIKKEGIKNATKNITPIVGIPVSPMLCQRLKTTSEMIKKMKVVSVEPKFDGLRVLIHYSKTKKILKAFTRNLNDISGMFPELTEISKHLNANEVILDSEAVGMDPDLIKIADFQTTMTRRRKHDVEELKNKVPLRFQVFDILYVDGKNIMGETYASRRDVLQKIVKSGALLQVDENVITEEPAVIKELHQKYRSNGLEGIITKRVDSPYVPGRVGWNWVKMKESEEQTGKLSDTVDAVIIGYSYGKGKRVGFGVGQFLVGVRDKDSIKSITKVGTGLSDEQFKILGSKLGALVTTLMPKEYEVAKALVPDVWVVPKIVVELAADDITVSPNHTAGYALRFPRLVRFREDKSVKDITTLSEIKKLFDLQTNK